MNRKWFTRSVWVAELMVSTVGSALLISMPLFARPISASNLLMRFCWIRIVRSLSSSWLCMEPVKKENTNIQSSYNIGNYSCGSANGRVDPNVFTGYDGYDWDYMWLWFHCNSWWLVVCRHVVRFILTDIRSLSHPLKTQQTPAFPIIFIIYNVNTTRLMFARTPRSKF